MFNELELLYDIDGKGVHIEIIIIKLENRYGMMRLVILKVFIFTEFSYIQLHSYFKLFLIHEKIPVNILNYFI